MILCKFTELAQRNQDICSYSTSPSHFTSSVKLNLSESLNDQHGIPSIDIYFLLSPDNI